MLLTQRCIDNSCLVTIESSKDAPLADESRLNKLGNTLTFLKPHLQSKLEVFKYIEPVTNRLLLGDYY